MGYIPVELALIKYNIGNIGIQLIWTVVLYTCFDIIGITNTIKKDKPKAYYLIGWIISIVTFTMFFMGFTNQQVVFEISPLFLVLCVFSLVWLVSAFKTYQKQQEFILSFFDDQVKRVVIFVSIVIAIFYINVYYFSVKDLFSDAINKTNFVVNK